jgi:amidase
MAGDDARDPLSKPRPTHSFLAAAQARLKPLRVAYSPDLGITPVDPQVAEITRRAAHRFSDAGVIVEETHPDLSDAYEIFQVLRAHSYAIGMSGLLRDHRDKLKPEVIWNTEKGLAQPMEMVVKAELARTALAARMADFFEKYDVLLCPATIVPPFPVGERYVKQCNGVDFATYVDWLLIVAPATLAACPALSLPCGFTKDGLPVGLQMIGASNGDARLLSAAGVLEDVLGLQTVRPVDPRS